MTAQGWKELERLQPGDKVHLLNRKGGFGQAGSLELGRVMGWMMGDGTLNMAEGAALMFFGDEQELAPLFAGYVDAIAAECAAPQRLCAHAPYTVGVQAWRHATSRVSSRCG